MSSACIVYAAVTHCLTAIIFNVYTQEEAAQVNGIVVLGNMDDMSFEHLKHMSRDYFKLNSSLIQVHASPCLHHLMQVHAPPCLRHLMQVHAPPSLHCLTITRLISSHSCCCMYLAQLRFITRAPQGYCLSLPLCLFGWPSVPGIFPGLFVGRFASV